MYYARLIEVMEGEYPVTRQILGADAFAECCRRYVAKYPSRTRTLNSLSAKFPDFLARSLPPSGRHGLAVDVARIERAMEDVFDGPRSEPMTAAEFAAVGSDAGARLRVNPALRFLKLRYPANAYMTAQRRGDRPRIPRPRETHVIVFRRGYQVFRRDQEPEQFKLLQALVAGLLLAAAVRASIGSRAASADRVAQRLGKWFEEWAGAHLFIKGDVHRFPKDEGKVTVPFDMKRVPFVRHKIEQGGLRKGDGYEHPRPGQRAPVLRRSDGQAADVLRL